MPKFLDAHKFEGEAEELLSPDVLQELVNAPRNEMGMKWVNVFYNEDERIGYCLIDAPSREVVEKHHRELGLKCEWLMEVENAKLIT